MGVGTGVYIPVLSLQLHTRICRQSLTYFGHAEETLISCGGTHKMGCVNLRHCFHGLKSSAQIGLWKLQELLHLLSDEGWNPST